MAEPLVSAIVLTYHTPKDTVRCVRALRNQTIADRMEIIVVDNHSEDDSIGVIRNTFGNDPVVRIVETPRNLGYGQGNETGVRLARGTYLLVINPDVQLPPDGAERMVQALEKDPAIGMLGPQLYFPDGSIRDSYRTFPHVVDIVIKRTFLHRFFRKRMARYLQQGVNPSEIRDVDWLAGGCILMPLDFYRSLGGFDRRFFLFFEDTDLCRRVWAAGKRVVYYPKVRALDGKQRLSAGGFFSIFTKKTVRIHLASAAKYFWKWKSTPS
jgi:GT2 family glycosyltransferase